MDCSLKLHHISQLKNKIGMQSQKHTNLFSIRGIASVATKSAMVCGDNYKCRPPAAAAQCWCWEVYGARRKRGELCSEQQMRVTHHFLANFPQSGFWGWNNRWELQLWALTDLCIVRFHQQTLVLITSKRRAHTLRCTYWPFFQTLNMLTWKNVLYLPITSLLWWWWR